MGMDAEKNYRASGFLHELGFGQSPALVLVDFVRAYTEESSPLYAGVEDVRARCELLLGIARKAGIPIFHTCVSYRPGTDDGGMFRRKLPVLSVFEQGSPLAGFAQGLAPHEGETVVTKHYASAFFGTSLAADLHALGVDTVLLAGVTTSGCIRASAVDAVQNDFHSMVITDAVGDRLEGPHEANLFDLQAKYSDLVTVEEVHQYLAGLK